MGEVTVSVKNMEKSFGGIKAIHDIDLEFRAGEIHALMGENGAGKSTLCKILSGAYTPDKGTITVNGREYASFTPHTAKSEGIGMIYQEFNLVNEMTVYENIFLGKELRNGPIIKKKEMIARANQLFESLNIKIDPRARIRDLSVAYCQLIEIAKTLQENARIIIFDEPTAPLTTEEIENLFKIIRSLRDQGMTIIYISHRMDEIEELTDRVTVMRDGQVIKTLKTAETDRREIIRLMIGRTLDETFPQRKPSVDRSSETPALEVRGLTNSRIDNVNFKVYKGEILGLSGLVGSGRTEIVRAIFGADAIQKGQIFINGRPVDVKHRPDVAIKNGISLVPEDRKREGLHLELPIKTNLTLARVRDMSTFFTIKPKTENAAVNDYVNTLSIKIASVRNPVDSLSGGNQQKVVISKWLLTGGDVILFDEPTRGIDVGAKKEIYDLMDKLRSEGKAIIMISSEMPEIVGMCDRVIVMYEGHQQGELPWEEMSQDSIMTLASGMDN